MSEQQANSSQKAKNEWTEDVLGNYVAVRGRIGWRGLKAEEYTDEGVYLIAGNHIVSGRVDWDICQHISRFRYLESLEIALEPGDVILSKDGTIGRVAFIARLPGDATINSTMMLIRIVKPTKLDGRFIYYLLQGHDFQKLVTERVSGSSIPHIFQADMKRLRISFPNISEQRQIADILSTLDEAIAQSEVLVRKYQSIRQGLMADLLTYGTRKDRELVKTPIGLMPKEWDLETIGSIAIHVGSGATPKGGSTVYLTQGVLFIRSQNVAFDGLLLDDVAFIDAKTHKRMERSEIFAHDVLLNITGASIGRCCPFPRGFGEANVNQHVCAIRLPEPNHADAVYLSSVLESWIGQSQIETLNAGGNRQGLNYQQLRSFKIPWPKKNERAEIAEIIEAGNSTLSAERHNLEKLSALKQGLMQDLLSGQVRVV